VVLPVTGNNATDGKDMQNAIEMAVKKINDSGGVIGKKLKIEVADDGCDPQMATQGASSWKIRQTFSGPTIRSPRRIWVRRPRALLTCPTTKEESTMELIRILSEVLPPKEGRRFPDFCSCWRALFGCKKRL
jgi:Periplasmic binding protein